MGSKGAVLDREQPLAPRPTLIPQPTDGTERSVEAQVLELQRQVGNAAVTALLAPAGPPAPAAPSVYRPTSDFDTMTLSDFNDYANHQADWARDPALTAARRASLVGVLEFARAGDRPPLGPCGAMTVNDLETSGMTADVRADLRAYARGVQGADSASCKSTAVLADARRDGNAISRLERGIPRQTLHQNMGSTDEGKAEFPLLVASGFVDDLAAYYKEAHPTLEADNGADIRSYLAMRATADPRSYVGRLPDIHNYHRFLPEMLDQLIANFGDKGRSRPVLLILHSGSDHNGAFHRDAGLLAVVQHPRNLALMVEGAASLDALDAEAERIGRHYGPGGKIQQVMLAGHGGPRVMEMAGQPGVKGSVAAGTLDLDHNKARTEKFLRRLVSHMAPGPDADIVLNACLTAAEEIDQPLDSDPKVAKQQILNSLAHHPSLAGRIGQMAPGIRVEGNVSSVSAGEYMATDAAGNPTGVLHQQIPTDPLATSTDLADYIEKGQEPEGCAHALVATWARDRPTAEARVAIRRGQPIGGWQDRVIHVIYDLFAAHPDDIALINHIANDAARGLSEFNNPAEQTTDNLGGVDSFSAAEEAAILGPLYGSTAASGQLVMNEVWMNQQPSRQADFMTVLDSFATTTALEPYLSLGWVRPAMAALLPMAAAAAPTSGQAKLALWAVTHGGDPTAKAFLKAGAAASHHVALPGGATVDGLTGSSATEDDILRAIGLLGSPGAPAAPAAAAPTLNVDLDGDGVNDFHVDSVTREEVVAASWLNVRARPDMSGARVDVVPFGTTLYVFGVSGDWLAIDRPDGRGTGFVHKAWVRSLAGA